MPFFRMDAFIFLLICFAFPSQAQLRSCFDVDGTPSLDFPCDPSSNVSSCCSSGGICATSLYCISPKGARIVGTCTDRNFTDKACPWPLGKANASTNFDHFDYTLNTTTCNDGTICPSQSDPKCCSAGRGKVEISFHNNAKLPSASRGLISYYAAAGYTIAVTASATAAATAATTTISRKTTVPSPSSSQASSIPASTSLSRGSKVGIGIGVCLLAVLALALPILFLLRRRKGQRKADTKSSLQESQEMIPCEELSAEQSVAIELPAITTYPPLAEMEAQYDSRKTWNAPN